MKLLIFRAENTKFPLCCFPPCVTQRARANMLQAGAQEDFGFFPDLKQYVLPPQQPAMEYAGKQGLMPSETPIYETEGSNDFFSSFLNSDFPIDISFPVQTVPESIPVKGAFLLPPPKTSINYSIFLFYLLFIFLGFSAQQSRVQPQAPLMQVAQSQAPTYYKSKNPTKYSGKRKAPEPAPAPTPAPAEEAAPPKERREHTDQENKRQKRYTPPCA